MKFIKSVLFWSLICLLLFACTNNDNNNEINQINQNDDIENINNNVIIEGTNQVIERINEMKSTSEYLPTDDVDLCDTVKFGKYEIDADLDNGLEDIEWILLDKNENTATLISKYILDCKQFVSETEYLSREWQNAAKRYIKNGGDKDDLVKYEKDLKDYLIQEEYGDYYNECTWKNSTLRYWLNNSFYNTAFTKNEKKLLLQSRYESIKDKISKDLIERINTSDVVTMLSKKELKEFFNYNYKLNSILPYARPTNYAKSVSNYYINGGLAIRSDGILSGYANYWLRDQGPFSDTYTIFDNPELSLNNFENEKCHYAAPDDFKIGVRPVIKINLNTSDIIDEYIPISNEIIDFKSRPFVDRNINPTESQNEKEIIDYFDPFSFINEFLTESYESYNK